MKTPHFIVPGGASAPPAFAPGVAVRATMENLMFKNTSRSQQYRADASFYRSTENTSGIDESVFRANGSTSVDDDYESFVRRKQELQLQKTSLKGQIALACASRRDTGRTVSSGTWAHLQKENLELNVKIAEIDRKITDIKRLRKIELDEQHRRKTAEKHNNFEFVFFSTAKEMLSGPVFDRLTTAALHRMAQMNGG